MKGWRVWALCAVLGCLVLAWPSRTGATFTTATRSALSSATAAADWTTPIVSVQALSATSAGTVTVTATATDSRSGVASVRLETAAVGGSTWTALCTRAVAPYACGWDTTTTADGGYQVRAVATDGAGNAALSTVVTTQVFNQVVVSLADPGSPLRGSIPLSATLSNPGVRTVTSFRLEWSVADAGSWTAIAGCTSLTTILACAWTPATGDYDLRAVAVVGGTTYAALVEDTTIDNGAPSVSLASLPTLSGVVNIAATATDAETGVATVEMQYAPTGTTTWVSLCTTTASPYTCRFDTTKVTDGSYDLRAMAVDYAGNSTASALQKKATVNNSVASVSVDSPGSYVSGSITLSANANSSNGVASVAIQYALHSGSGSWMTICTDVTSPYTCAWVTSLLTDGSYDLHAVLTDKKGIVTTSATFTTTSNNSPLRARDAQTTNGTGTAGRIDAGDQVVFGFTNLVTPGSLLTGWDGTARTVTVRFQDGQLVGGGSTDDTLSVDGVALGSVNLHGSYVQSRKTATATATMTATTTLVGGLPTTTATLVLGQPGSGLTTVSTVGAMVWTPSANAKTPAGIACSTTPVTESGTADRDF